MNRYYTKKTGKSAEGESKKVDAFLKDVEELCKKHGLSIAHEDSHGGFLIEDLSDFNLHWLKQASIGDECSVGDIVAAE